MKNKSVLKRVLSVIGHFKISLALSLIISVASVILTLYIPVLAGNAIDGIAAVGGVNCATVKRALFGILICAVLGSILNWLMTVINNRIAYNTVRELRDRAFSHLQSLPVAFSDAHPHGDIVSRVIADAEQFAPGCLGEQMLQSFRTCRLEIGTHYLTGNQKDSDTCQECEDCSKRCSSAHISINLGPNLTKK